MLADPKSAKMNDCIFCALGTCPRKSCSQNVGEIDPWTTVYLEFVQA